MNARWRIETGVGNTAFTLHSEHGRAWDAWKTWDALELEPNQKKRISLRGRVVRRERRLPAPEPAPVAQEALWTA